MLKNKQPLKLACIAVTYNNYAVLKDFLNSWQKQEDQDFHLYLTDQSDKKQPLPLRLKNITIISAENKGFARGINLALNHALADDYNAFCIINNDTFFDSDFVTKIKRSLSNFTHSLIGGKIYYAPGYEYHKNRYKQEDLGKVVWYAGGFVDWRHALSKHHGVDEVDKGQFNQMQKTNFITGCLMVFDKSVIETVGLLNEKYFLYYEDADWCERAKGKGVDLIFDPSIVIWHKVSQSTGGSGSLLHQKYQEKNRLVFGLKYAPWKTKFHLAKNFLISWLIR